jgi:hypothetical protein
MRHHTAIVILGLLLGAALLLGGCGGTNGQGGEGTAPDAKPVASPPAEGQPLAAAIGPCAVDADCVPAECCHPKTCVHKDAAPDCRDMMCTMDCRGGTMDCGGGRCLCDGGECRAEIFPPKKPKILSDPPPPPMPE